MRQLNIRPWRLELAMTMAKNGAYGIPGENVEKHIKGRMFDLFCDVGPISISKYMFESSVVLFCFKFEFITYRFAYMRTLNDELTIAPRPRYRRFLVRRKSFSFSKPKPGHLGPGPYIDWYSKQSAHPTIAEQRIAGPPMRMQGWESSC